MQGVENVLPGLFSWGLPAASSLTGFSEGGSFFSWVELRLPRRPGERSAGEGSAPESGEVVERFNVILSFCPPELVFSSLFSTSNLQWIW